MPLRVGDAAPDFALPSMDGETVALRDFRGRWVVLVFLRWLG
jgi:peroxiredoxin